LLLLLLMAPMIRELLLLLMALMMQALQLPYWRQRCVQAG
jgi:hypothetical protein